MAYIGKFPADVLIDPHVDSAAITDGTIITADIANDAVTSAKLAENSVDSSELIDGSVDNSHLAGSIAMNKTLLTAGTGLTLSTNTLSVDAAQSQITSVGTLTSLTTSGTATFGGHITAPSQQLTNFQEIRIDDAELYFTDTANEDYWRFRRDASDNFVLDHWHTGGSAESALSFDSSKNPTFAGELRVNGGQASIYGAEGGNAILELNSDEADDNADRWQMYVFNTNNYLKWRHYGSGSWVDRLWLSSATDNWAMNLTANSPYGMQITTTASNSSSHDVFKIKRGDGTTVFDVYGDGNTHVNNFLFTQKGIRIDTNASNVYPSIVGETADYELFRLEQWYGNEGALVIKKDGSNVIRFTGGQAGVSSYINNGANFGFGTANPSENVHIYSTASAATTLRIEASASSQRADIAMYGNYTGSNNNFAEILFVNAGDSVAAIQAGRDTNDGNGSIKFTTQAATLSQGMTIRAIVSSEGDFFTNDGTVSSLSDKRTKKDIADLEDGLSIINQLKPKTFKYNGKTALGSEDNKTRYGFIADDVLEVASQYVEIGTEKIDGVEVDDFKSLSMMRMFPMLVKAVQELSAKVEALESV